MHLTRIVILPLFLRNAATWVMCSPSVANKPKALSAASWDWNICEVVQSHILPEPSPVPFDAQ
jgi:hypothetical protein